LLRAEVRGQNTGVRRGRAAGEGCVDVGMSGYRRIGESGGEDQGSRVGVNYSTRTFYMTDFDLEQFRNRYNKLHEIGAFLLPEEADQQDRMRFALCLAEFYAWSGKVNRIIEELSSADFKIEDSNLATLSKQLFELKIALYMEIVQWLRKFRVPCKRIETLIGERVNDTTAAD
jgi:hypothetical protein